MRGAASTAAEQQDDEQHKVSRAPTQQRSQLRSTDVPPAPAEPGNETPAPQAGLAAPPLFPTATSTTAATCNTSQASVSSQGTHDFLTYLLDVATSHPCVQDEAGAFVCLADSAGLFHVPVRIQGKEVDAIVDTGAAYCIVSESVARRVGLALEPPPPDLNIRVANGDVTAPDACFTTDLVVAGEATVSPVLVLVMRDLPCPMLLGSNYLHDMGVSLAYDPLGAKLTVNGRSFMSLRAPRDPLVTREEKVVHVRLVEDLVLPPGTGTLAPGRADVRQNRKYFVSADNVDLVEGLEVPDSLIQTTEGRGHRIIKVPVLNRTRQALFLAKDQLVATAERLHPGTRLVRLETRDAMAAGVSQAPSADALLAEGGESATSADRRAAATQTQADGRTESAPNKERQPGEQTEAATTTEDGQTRHTQAPSEADRIAAEDDARAAAEVISALRFGPSLSAEGRARIKDLLSQYLCVLSLSEFDVGRTDLVQHVINTGDAAPRARRPYRISFQEQQAVDRLIKLMVEKKLIRPSTSPWSAPIIIVPKKDKSIRFCCDWRDLNEVTVKDTFPLPRPDATLDRLGKMKFFTILDFRQGYFQVPMHPDSIEKTAFSTPTGHWEFLVTGMGLTGSPATFQRMMTRMLGPLLHHCCLAYLDDVVVMSETLEDHVRDLQLTLDRIASAGLKINPAKCLFATDTFKFLGHVVTPEGLQCDPDKIAKVRDWPVPSNVTEVRKFLGFVGYYRRFIEGFSRVARPLTQLTRTGAAFNWTDECQAAFEHLRQALISEPILKLPDFSQKFILSTDACDYGLGAVLKQLDEEGRERVVAYASRMLTPAETRYTTSEKECLALVHATKIFRPYLYGTPFTCYTDHQALCFLNSVRNPNGRLARWSLHLRDFECEIKYKAGTQNADADALSRSGTVGTLTAPCGLATFTPVVGATADAVVSELMPCHGLTSRLASHKREGSVPLPTPAHATRGRTLTATGAADQVELTASSTASTATGVIALCLRILDGTGGEKRERHETCQAEMSASKRRVHEVQVVRRKLNRVREKEEGEEGRQELVRGEEKGLLACPIRVRDEDSCDGLADRQTGLACFPVSTVQQSLDEHRRRAIVTAAAAQVTERGNDGIDEALIAAPPIEEELVQRLRAAQADRRREPEMTRVQDILDGIVTEASAQTARQAKRLQREISNVRQAYRRHPQTGVLEWKTKLVVGSKQSYENHILTPWVTCVPKSLRRKVVEFCHDSLCGGHFGLHKTLDLVQRRFTWPGMRSYVYAYVRSCERCRLAKHDLRPKQGFLQPIAPRHLPFEAVGMDKAGPIKGSAAGYCYIFTAVDYATRFAVAAAYKSATAADAADFFLNHVCAKFGYPAVLITDHGPEFEGTDFEARLARSPTVHRFSTPYHPATNGLVERFNGTISQYLRIFRAGNFGDWEKYVPHAVIAYNASKHAVHGFAPHYLLFGMEPRLGSIIGESPQPLPEPAARMQEIAGARTVAHRRLIESQALEKERVDAHRRPVTVQPGDMVVIRNPTISGRLSDPFLGPFRVKTTHSNNTVTIQDLVGKEHTLNTERIALMQQRPLDMCGADRAEQERLPPSATVPRPASTRTPLMDLQPFRRSRRTRRQVRRLQLMAATAARDSPRMAPGVSHQRSVRAQRPEC